MFAMSEWKNERGISLPMEFFVRMWAGSLRNCKNKWIDLNLGMFYIYVEVKIGC